MDERKKKINTIVQLKKERQFIHGEKLLHRENNIEIHSFPKNTTKIIILFCTKKIEPIQNKTCLQTVAALSGT